MPPKGFKGNLQFMMRLLAAIFALTVLFVAPSAHAACTNPAGNAGAIFYNTTQKIFEYCDNTNWKRMNVTPGAGSGGCTSPTLAEGQMVYNIDQRVLQGCAGNVHRPFGPIGGANKWKQFDYNDIHACGVRADKSVWCWGSSTRGQVGNNSAEESDFEPTPVSLTGGGTWKMVATSISHSSYGNSCGIKTDDTIWCWGEGGYGQNGNGAANFVDGTPVALSGGQTWKTVSLGTRYGCAIRSDDTLWCWGNNTTGQIGNGGTGQQNTPVQVSGGGTWKAVSTGEGTACGIKSDDTAWCWGRRDYGAIGDGGATSGNQTTPAAVSGGFTWKSVSVGLGTACAIRSNDTAYCWGYGGEGQRGDGSYTNSRTTPAIVTGGFTWKSVDVGLYTTCGVRTTGAGYCWGDNAFGTHGNGTTTGTNAPAAVSGGFSWQYIKPGRDSTCGLKTDGAVMCWGNNLAGVLGSSKSDVQFAPIEPVTGGPIWTSITTASGLGCAIRSDQTAWCWGWNSGGQNGIGSNVVVPTQIINGGTWLKLNAGITYDHTCGIKTDGTAWCWGNEDNGELGNGASGGGATPSAVSGGFTWKEINVGNNHSCAIRSDDTAYCWGEDTSGRLGNGGGGNTTTPGLVTTTGVLTWSSLTTGLEHSCGIKTDGTAWCWGEGGSGRLGTGNSTDQQTPTAVTTTGVLTWKKIVAGNYHNCGIKTDDTLWCWGDNYRGSLGDGTTTTRNTPVQVSGGGTWVDVAAGAFSSCGIKTDGTAWCWGDNSAGQIGNGLKTGSASNTAPVAVAHDGISWSKIDAAGSNTCGMKVNGEIYCWGNDAFRGINSTSSSLTAVPMACTSPTGTAGSMKYNSTSSLMQYCDGVSWVGLRGGATPPLPDESIPTSGLVAYWAFNETAGSTTAADSSGNGNTGTLQNMDPSTDWVAGRVGNGLDFDGTNDRVFAGSNAILDNMTNRTVCVWTYPRPAAVGVDRMVVSKYEATFTYGWDIYQAGGASSIGGTGYYQSESTTDGVWQHYCVTRTGSTVKVYKNGAEIFPLSTGAYGSAGSDAAYDLYIGSDVANASPFNGIMDELRIYNRVLSLSEIQALAAQ